MIQKGSSFNIYDKLQTRKDLNKKRQEGNGARKQDEVWGDGGECSLEEDTAGLRGIGLTRPWKGTGSVEPCSRNTSKGELKKQPRDKPGRQSSNTQMPLPGLLLKATSFEFLIAQTLLRLMNALTPSFVFICIIFSPVLFQENYYEHDNEWETRGKS